MQNDQLFLDIPVLQRKHAGKRGMPKQPSAARATPVLHTADLTQAIIKYIRARGGYAVRINCTGIYDAKSGHWRKSTTPRGTADIHACWRGQHLSIEIKNGDDRQSAFQENCQEQVTRAGGIYLIVSHFAEFHLWFHTVNQDVR